MLNSPALFIVQIYSILYVFTVKYTCNTMEKKYFNYTYFALLIDA